MQARSIASAFGRSRRHLRFITLVSVLALIDIWLLAQLALRTSADSTQVRGEMMVALAAGTAALMAALWRNPLSRDHRMMNPPLLQDTLATHRAGHIVATYLEDPARVTTAALSDPCAPQSDHVPAVTQTSLRAELAIALAGLTAEEIVVGESGSHAATDLARATTIGADMVGRYGMRDSLVSLAASRPGKTDLVGSVLEDARTRKELEALLRDAKRDTMRMMLEHRHVIIELRDALIRHRRLDTTRIRQLIEDAEQGRDINDTVLVDLRSATERTRHLVDVSEL